MTNFNDLARRVMDLAGLSNEQPDLNVAAARIIALEADVARLREALELLLARSEVVRVLAAEQAEKMPSRLSWLADMDLFYEAQRKARAEIARASVVLAALEARND